MSKHSNGTSTGNVKDILSNLQQNLNKTFELIKKAEFIRKEIQNALQNESTSLVETPTVISSNNQGGLKNNDRVVWMINDDEPEIGTVKWLGLMHDGLVAGVEFDEPIGNSDGNLDGNKLFHCRPRHGRFVLVRELMLWSDFSGERVK